MQLHKLGCCLLLLAVWMSPRRGILVHYCRTLGDHLKTIADIPVEVVIGRDTRVCQLVLNANTYTGVSGRHATIRLAPKTLPHAFSNKR